jgi:hypothetical protein
MEILKVTAGTWPRMIGVDVYNVSQVLGHKDLRMATRYNTAVPSAWPTLAENLAQIFSGLRYQGVTNQKATEQVRL